MVRVALGDDLLTDPRCILVAQSMGWGQAQTLGALALLWLKTRMARICDGTADQLAPYLPVGDGRREALFHALVQAGFIEAGEGGLYTVVGNVEFGRLREQRAEAGRRGRAKTRLVTKARLAAREKKAKQAARSNAEKPAAPVRRPKPKTETANQRAWEAYRCAYQQRWGVDPTRNARVNACISQFVQRIGADAPQVLEFFVRHNDAVYLRSAHSMTLAVRDAEGLHTQWRRGQVVTMRDVMRLEQQSGIADQLRRIEEGAL